MVPRSVIVILAFLVFVGACTSEQIPQEGTDEPRRGGEVEPERPTAGPALTATSVPTATPTPVPTPSPSPISTPVPLLTTTPGPKVMLTPTRTPTPASLPDMAETLAPACVGNEESDKLCEARDVSDFDFFSASLGNTSATPSVEDVLEKGLELSEASPVHLAFRGTAQSDTVRCGWRGVARTIQQREKSIRYWLGMDEDEALPSPAEVERRFIDYVNRMDPRCSSRNGGKFRGTGLGWPYS